MSYKLVKNIMHSRLRALKPLVVAVSIACFSLTGCSKQDDNTSEGEAQQLLSRAQSYQMQGQYRAAVIEAKNALQKDPKNPAAQVLIAKIYSELGDTKQALSILEKADTAKNGELYLAHLEALVERGKGQTALEQINKPPSDLTVEQQEFVSLYKAKALVLTGDVSHASSLYQKLRSSHSEQIQLAAATGQAAIAFQANNIAEANSILDAILVKAPKETDALVLKAAIAYKIKDLDTSEELLTQALIGLPNTDLLTVKRATVLDSLINVLTLRGRTAEAMVYTKMLAEARPGAETSKAQFDEAIELLKAGNYKDAEQKLLQVYNENNAPDAAGRLLGIIRMQEGDLEGAAQYFAQHVDPETANPEILRLLAENQLRLNKSAEALSLIEENINRSPNDPDLLSVYGLAALAEGQEQKGVDAINKVLKMDPQRTKLNAALADHYLRKGDTSTAINLLREGISKTPKDLELRTQLIRVLFMTGQTETIKEEAGKLEKELSDNAEAQSVAGSSYLQLKQKDQARAAFEKGLGIDSNNINSMIGLSLLEMQSSNWDKARAYADKVVSLDTNNMRAYKLLAAIAGRTGQVEAYVDKLKQISSSAINGWGAEASLGEYYLAIGDDDQALVHTKEALARSAFRGYPRTLATRVYLQLARKQVSAKNITETRHYLMEGLQTNPHDLDLLDMLAHLEITAEKFTEVDKIILQIRDSHPRSIVPDLIEADKLRKQGNKAGALNTLQALWEKSPSDPVAIRIMPLLDEAAREKFTAEWASKAPRSANAVLFTAMQKQTRGDTDGAVAGYEQVLALNPNEPRALNNLAWIKFENGQMKQALELSTKAAELSPGDAAVLDTHGWILFNNGDKEKAREVLKRALELAPEIQEVKDHYEAALK